MFDHDRLAVAVELQQRAYRLLLWLSRGMKLGWATSEAFGDVVRYAAEAEQWLASNIDSLPPSARPPDGALMPYATMFASFLATSWELRQTGRGVDLTVRHLSPKSNAAAVALKRLALVRLADELELPFRPDELEPLLRERDLAEPLAWLAYGVELLRRTEYASQGEGIARLWREIAWRDRTSPKPDFELTVGAFEAAETALTTRLRALAGEA